MQRITRKQLDYQVELLNKALGTPLESWSKVDGHNVAAIGNIHLASGYGGFKLEQMCNESGGIRTVGADYRMTARESYLALRMMLEGIQLARNSK